jgi:hypothetical protein
MLALNTNEQSLRNYIAATVNYFAALKVIPRHFSIYPFDSVGLELLSKSVSIANSCLVLVQGNQPEEALGLGRSLVEVSLILRHITRDKSHMHREANKFLQFAFKDKNFWLFHARKRFTEAESAADIEYHAAKWNYKGDHPMAATRSWSDKFSAWTAQAQSHPLDHPDSTKDERSYDHATEYTQASFFVHCTQPALDNFFPECGVPFEIKNSSHEYIDSRETIFYLVLTNLHRVVLYLLFGLGLDAPLDLIKLFDHTIENAVPSEFQIFYEGKFKRWRR